MGTNLMSLMSRTGGGFSKFGAGTTLIKQVYDVQDYYGWGTSDLVSMWDGIRNVGATSAHDPSSTTWADLSGNGHDSTVVASCFIDNSAYDVSKVSDLTFTDVLTEQTIEIVCDITTWANDSAGIFLRLSSAGVFVGRYNAKFICSKNGYLWTNSQFVLPSPYPKSYSVSYISSANKEALFDGIEPERATENWNASTPGTSVGSINNEGKIYAIRVYNKVLTTAQKLANYAIDQQRFNLT